MRKRFITFVAAFLILLMAVPAMAVVQEMSAAVYRWSGNYNADGSPGVTRATTGITYKVLAQGSNTAETIYSDRKLTAKTNPVTTTVFAADDNISFWVDPTDTTDDRYVDLIVTDTVGGYSAIVKNFDKYQRAIVIDERPNVQHHGIIWWTSLTDTEVDTGIQLPYLTAVHDVRIEITAPSTDGTTLHVGLLSSESGGDADGYVKSRLTTTAGFPADTAVVTAGASAEYWPVTTTGAFLATGITGTGAGDTLGGGINTGGLSRLTHFIVNAASARTLSYTASTADGAAYGGYIHYWFTKLR